MEHILNEPDGETIRWSLAGELNYGRDLDTLIQPIESNNCSRPTAADKQDISTTNSHAQVSINNRPWVG